MAAIYKYISNSILKLTSRTSFSPLKKGQRFSIRHKTPRRMDGVESRWLILICILFTQYICDSTTQPTRLNRSTSNFRPDNGGKFHVKILTKLRKLFLLHDGCQVICRLGSQRVKSVLVHINVLYFVKYIFLE
jgi:hypothetical protein